MSFLDPEPEPRELRIEAWAMVPLALLAAADAIGFVDLNGLALPLFMSGFVIFTIVQARVARRVHGIEDHG